MDKSQLAIHLVLLTAFTVPLRLRPQLQIHQALEEQYDRVVKGEVDGAFLCNFNGRLSFKKLGFTAWFKSSEHFVEYSVQ